MKTTIEIPDALLDQLRVRAARQKTTLRALMESALRQFLEAPARGGEAAFRLKDGSVGGDAAAREIEEGDWRRIRDLIYEGRGGAPTSP